MPRPRPHAPLWCSGCKKIPASSWAVVEAAQADGETDGTKLFSALSAALADVPPDRVAGAFPDHRRPSP